MSDPQTEDKGNRHSTSRQWGQENEDRAAESAPGQLKPGDDLDARQDQLVDEAVEETFPASDPISPKQITR
jgi:hypothetical protein